MNPSDLPRQRVLVTGANRGLGLEFVRQYLGAGATVFAGCRAPAGADTLQQLAATHGGRLLVHALDVRDTASIDAMVDAIDSHANGRLDILINNAGTSPRGEEFSNIRSESMLEVLRVNTVAPLIMAQHCHGLLIRSPRPRIVNISSSMGSLAKKDYGRHFSYASSKAGLNMVTRAEAADLQVDGIIVVSLHPGWVQTDLGGPQATLSPRESVEGMTRVITGLKPEDSGRFLTWSGEEHPW